MKACLARGRSKGLTRWGWLAAAALLCGAIGTVVVAVDSDEDSMDDVFEVFFGLNPNDAGDASLDNDGDAVTNWQEAARWTDPFAPDTDRDGFRDDVDSNGLSRVYIEWGSAFFTRTNEYVYTGPAWWLGAWKDGGEFITNELSHWYVPSTETGAASLNIDLDRLLLTNDLRLWIGFLDGSNASLYIDLYDTNDVATNLTGNLLDGSGELVESGYNIPLEANADAVGIRLRRGGGEIRVYETRLFIDVDGDGLDADQEIQLGTSDALVDSDYDGLSDYDEVFVHNSNPTETDSDNDGMSDGFEVLHGGNPASFDSYAVLPFLEGFETNTCAPGALNGQNGWIGTPTNAVFVQGSTVLAGDQALQVGAKGIGYGSAKHLFRGSGTYAVWLDFHVRGMNGLAPTGAVESTTELYFNEAGRLVVYDGFQAGESKWVTLTNHAPVTVTDWVRITIKMDYIAKEWDVYLNGVRVARELGFANDRGEFSGLEFESKDGFADGIYLSTVPPGDIDNDGLSSEQETALGTDPEDPDSDNDGMGDGTEYLVWGAAPTVSNSYFRIDWASGSSTFFTSFEASEGYSTGGLNGQQNWIASNGVLVVDSASHTGLQSVSIASRSDSNAPLQELRADIGGCGRNDLWVTFYTKLPQGKLDPDGSEPAPAVDMHLRANRLYAFDGTLEGWVISGKHFDIGSDDWTRVDLHLDYSTKRYDVALNGVLALDSVNFRNTSLTQPSRLVVSGATAAESRPTCVDDVRISAEEPEGLDFDQDGLSNFEEYALGTNPKSADTDGDGLSDFDEVNTHLTNPLEADTDGDSMPDAWEIEFGTNPLVMDGGADPDGDGLNNLQEYLGGADPFDADTDDDGLSDYAEIHTYNTDPASADMDGDGVPDKWEVEHGTSAQHADASADPDRDGLSNLAEYEAGTHPHMADTDGDSISDYEEVRLAFSDALTVDFDGTVENVSMVLGGDRTATLGTWFKSDGELFAASVRGHVDYTLASSNSGVYRVEIEARQQRDYPTNQFFTFVLKVYCDDHYLGRGTLKASSVEYGKARFYTPWIPAGGHQVRIVWENGDYASSLRIKSIALQDLGGPDSDSDGMRDWTGTRLSAIYGLDRGLGDSYVSPACLEGRAKFIDMMTLAGTTAVAGPGGRWYADLPLSCEAPTDVDVSFEGGVKTASGQVTWQPLNLLTAGSMILRKGDSIRPIVSPTGGTNASVSVEIAGYTNYETTVEEAAPLVFGSAGTYTLVGTYAGDPTVVATTAIQVVGGGFPGDIACMVGEPRMWACPELPEGISLEFDGILAVTNDVALEGGGRQLLVNISEDSPARVIARLGEEGPVLGGAGIEGMQGYVANALTVAETYPDGSQLIEGRLILSHLPTDLVVKFQIFAGGVTFEDGSLYHEATPEDFNALGEHRYRMLRPAGVTTSTCITIKVYQGSEYLGGD